MSQVGPASGRHLHSLGGGAKLRLGVRELVTGEVLEGREEMATHSSTLAWKIPRTEEPGRLRPWGRKESGMTERLHFVSLY